MCLLHLRHHHLLRHRSNFGASEPVGESERGRPFPLPFLFGSCLNARTSPNEHRPFVVQRIQSPLLVLCFGVVFAFALLLYLISELPLMVSISRFEMRILAFLLEMSLGHQLQSAIIDFLVARCSLPSVDLPQVFEFFQLFNLPSCTDSPTCCQ